MDYSSLGNKIKMRRLELNLTQEKLAEKANITTSFLGHIERAERRLSIDTLVSIANVLNISVDYLLSDSLSYNESNESAETIKKTFANQPAEIKKAAVELLQEIISKIGKAKV
jgi:transcriptional regulator with XRE-family HTH domain